MAVKNEFQPFATGVGALVKTPSDYQALAKRATGFTNGVADPAECNTAWRQPSMAIAMVGEIIRLYARQSAEDNGDVITLAHNFMLALRNQIGNINSPLTPWPVLVKSASVFSPPTEPDSGDCYIVPDNAIGVWDGYDDYVTEWDGTQWLFRDYPLGICVDVQDAADTYRRIAGGWRSIQATPEEVAAGTSNTTEITPYNLAQRLQAIVPGMYEGDYPPNKATVAPGSGWIESDTALGYELILSGGVRHWVENIL
jgi:hypothetical protein